MAGVFTRLFACPVSAMFGAVVAHRSGYMVALGFRHMVAQEFGAVAAVQVNTQAINVTVS